MLLKIVLQEVYQKKKKHGISMQVCSQLRYAKNTFSKSGMYFGRAGSSIWLSTLILQLCCCQDKPRGGLDGGASGD